MIALVNFFQRCKEYNGCLVSFSSFSELFPVFSWAKEFASLISVWPRVNILSSCHFCFLLCQQILHFLNQTYCSVWFFFIGCFCIFPFSFCYIFIKFWFISGSFSDSYYTSNSGSNFGLCGKLVGSIYIFSNNLAIIFLSLCRYIAFIKVVY